MTNGAENVLATQVAVGFYFSWVLQLLKNAKSLPFINQFTGTLNHGFLVVASAVGAIGVHFVWTPAQHSLLITNLDATAIAASLWLWAKQYAITFLSHRGAFGPVSGFGPAVATQGIFAGQGRAGAPPAATMILLAVLLSFAGLTGCAARVQHVTDLPPGVTEQQAKDYDAAVADLDKIATVTSSLRQAVTGLRKDGVFADDAAYGTTLLTLGKIDELQLAALQTLREQPQSFSADTKTKVFSMFKSIASDVQTLNNAGVTGIKNPDSLKQVNAMIDQLAAAVNLVLSL